MQGVDDPDRASGEVVFGGDTHGVALLVVGDEGGVVDFDDGMSRRVDVRQVGRISLVDVYHIA